MIQFFKNVRVLWFALALSASVHNVAQAEATAAATPKPTATPYVNPTFGGVGRLSLVTESGNFQSEFKSLSEALQAAQGNSYNQILKKGSEIIVMNARCTDGIFGDKVTFSLYRLSKDVEPLVKSFLDYRPTSTLDSLADQRALRSRALINEIIRLVSVASPRKADCDAVPVALSLKTAEALRLEADDAQSPLVGAKINDGFLYDNLMQSTGFNAVVKNMPVTQQRAFWEKYAYNRFPTAQDALNAAVQQAGTKLLIYNGANFSLYRVNDLKFDHRLSDEKVVEAFKTTPIRKGWKIVALVRGAKWSQIL